MSWQDYVDTQLLVDLPHGGRLSHAAIVGMDGGVWASSAGFPDLSQVCAPSNALRFIAGMISTVIRFYVG